MKLVFLASAVAFVTGSLPFVSFAGDTSEKGVWSKPRTDMQPQLIQVQNPPAQGKMAMPVDGATYMLGELEISSPFAFATMPNAPVAGGFMTITNSGSGDDRLIGAASDAAGRMEIHEMTMDGDVMKMRELEDGLTVPAGQTATLQPGGYHVMFMDLSGPFTEGQSITVTLTFENSGDVEIVMPVVARVVRGGHGHGMSSN